MSDATERWLPVIGWEGRYEVSDFGRIKSLRRLLDGRLLVYIMNPSVSPHGGHLQVRLSAPGRRVMAYVHQMVAAAFIGPRPPGLETRHWDGDTTNNRPSNLLYGTSAENAQDRVRHGRAPAGIKHSGSALTAAGVIAMRTTWQQGTEVRDLARRFGVSKATASRVVHGLAYREIPMFPRPPEKCHYPQCRRVVVAGKEGRSWLSKFCDLPEHNNYEAKKARNRLNRIN